jgi:hypothetical protein
MIRSSLILAAATLALTLTPFAGDAFAGGRSHGKGFAIFDQNGDTLFDDGKLDGKGCVIGKKAVFDKKTGGLKVVNAAKCNF